MREQATRFIAFVVLLLGVVFAGLRHGEPVLAASQRDQGVKVYIPIVHIRAQEPAGDLQIVHMGLYQSVQNHSNGVTLIAHKPALLRVYAQSLHTGTSTPVTGVTIDAYRDGLFLGSLTAEPKPVSAQPSADDMHSTYNFDLPIQWLDGQVVLTATVDKANSVAELNELNNTSQSTFQFRSVAPLNLTIVPINYVDTVTGITFSEPGQDPISQWLLSAFPISDIRVAIHAPYTFTGDLRKGEEWTRLLEELTTVWASEVGPGSPHIYYGLVPNSTPTGASWFEGGVSGLGWIGQRVSVGLNVGPETGESAGHEIGHNFGRHHAPCGNPSNVDPHFPYPNALIGEYGVDTTDETLLDPNLTHDVMSYCGPEWVSDYTYEGLFQDQFQQSNRTGVKGEGLFLSAAINGETITALPPYLLEQPFLPMKAFGDYQVQLLDERGQVIGVYPAELYEAEESGASASMLVTYVPIPGDGTRVGKVQFLKGEAVVAGQVVNDISDLR